AAVQLAADAVRIGDDVAAAAFRRRALASGVLAGAVAVGGLVVVHADAPRLFHGLTHGAGLACVIVSVLLGLLALGLVWRRRLDPARFAAGAAVAAIVAGWAVAQRPDVLPGLTVAEAAAPTSTPAAAGGAHRGAGRPADPRRPARPGRARLLRRRRRAHRLRPRPGRAGGRDR